MDVQTLTIAETTTHTHTVVFLHGRGDHARYFASSFQYFCTSQGQTLMNLLPSFRWIFPQAPTSLWTTSFGEHRPQWFDVYNTRNFAEREELQAVGLKDSVCTIRKLLLREAAVLNGRWDRVILAGISQGAATGLHTLMHLNLHSEHESSNADQAGSLNAIAALSVGSAKSLETAVRPRIAAFLGFSCRMPFTGRSLPSLKAVLDIPDSPTPEYTQLLLQNTPILLEHCRDDQTVLLEHGRNLRDTLQQFGAGSLEWREYPNGGHWFNSPTGADDLVKFLNRHVLREEEDKEATNGTDDLEVQVHGEHFDAEMTDA